jgi:hypothetical protein
MLLGTAVAVRMKPYDYLLAVAEPDLFGRPDRSVLQMLRSVSVRVTLHEGVKQTQDLRIR